MDAQDIEYDVFISHAYEDKHAFADELARALKEQGLRVWYSGFELRLGSSISSQINEALKSSSYGIVLLSPRYFEKQWPQSELQAMFGHRDMQSRILPVLLGISVHEARLRIPLLADRYAVSAAKGMVEVVRSILQVIKGPGPPLPLKKVRKTRKRKPKDTSASNHGITVSGNLVISGGQISGRDIINNAQTN